ncbi:MAG: hypothetical protein V4443_07820 [Pseudomonadota bacterium]
MIEFATLVIISVLLLIFLRPGKTPTLNNSLVIERAGEYHVTLSAQLNLTQQFIEAIAQDLNTETDKSTDSATSYFEIFDRNTSAKGHSLYLLAITRRNGILYFQATSPAPGNQVGHLNAIKEYSNAILARFPAAPNAGSSPNGSEADTRIVAAVEKAARLRNIDARPLVH